MLLDGRNIPSGTQFQADLCIVGAGPAGITVALEFRHQVATVVVLEAGGIDGSDHNQALYRGKVAGYPYPPLDVCRARGLGGTTSIWGGWCHALDSIDFLERDWVPWSGWPFRKEELEAEYQHAREICRVSEASDSSFSGLSGQASERFEVTSVEIAPTRFGQAYKKELANAANISVILHANALEVCLNSYNTEADSITVVSGARSKYSVSARCFILATGGIENARILLSSRASRSIGIGNENDLVGRFFSDHLHFYGDICHLPLPMAVQVFRPRRNGQSKSRGCLTLSETARRQDGLLGFAVTGHNPRDPHDVIVPSTQHGGYASLSKIWRALATGRTPENLSFHMRNLALHFGEACMLARCKAWAPSWRSVVFGCRAEQAPNPSSRVLLDDEKDQYGTYRAKLDWRLTEQDLESLQLAYGFLTSEPTRRGISPRHRLDKINLEVVMGASHHIGTTRMHRDPRLGVVDSNCRVHSVRNLFIAGSSVFPTAGWAPPTLTIVALASRLARFVHSFLQDR